MRIHFYLLLDKIIIGLKVSLREQPCISVRKPDSLSAARSTMLNENAVSAYFDKLGDWLGYFQIKNRPSQIFNMDESGVSTQAW